MKVKKKKGFTLIEIAVALAAFVIVMLAITGILISVIKFSSINSATYSTDNISKVFFETLKEDRVALNNMPKTVDTKYKCGFSNADEVRTFVKDHLLDSDLSNKPDGVSDPSDFNLCKQSSSDYSMGINISWNTDGFYEVETWCWDTNKGESSLINRKTYVTPR
ncbi:MAG: PilW family protein [Clostridium paraputrificum]